MDKKPKSITTTSTTWKVDTEITTIDQTKINKLFNKRHKLIMHLDQIKLQQQKDILYWLNKIVKLDDSIEEARKGKTIRKRFKKK